MDTPVLLAIIGSGLNTVNDLIYRNIARRSSANTFTFYVLAAFSSALTALVINLAAYGYISFSRVNISYGVLLGFLSFTVYILFLLSFNSSSTVVSVTIYRLKGWSLVPICPGRIKLMNLRKFWIWAYPKGTSGSYAAAT